MTAERAAAVLALLCALVLVVPALARRRLPEHRLWRLALLWAGLIAAAWVVATLGLDLQYHFT